MNAPATQPLHAAIERVLSPLAGELTFQALHTRVQEVRDVMFPASHLANALNVLVAGDVVEEIKIGQRFSYRWLGWKCAPVPAISPPEPALPPAQPTKGITVPKPLTSTPRGQTRERVRGIWLTDKTLSAGAIAAKLEDVGEDAVSYHLAKLRKEERANGGDTAATFVRASAAERSRVPVHKWLENAAPGCGLPIGNLSSQFFANVYLDALDQFVKHQLKAQRYLRYVDDFVLVHHDRDQLQAWLTQIERFLADKLRLQLKADIRLRPLTAGIDFLGYVVFPTHTRVRRRVISHANARRLQEAFRQRFPWLRELEVKRRIPAALEGRRLQIPVG